MPNRHFTAREKELARAILPILVQQALAGKTITYGKLAKKVGGIPWKLGNPLDYIRVMLDELREQCDSDIPHIQVRIRCGIRVSDE